MPFYADSTVKDTIRRLFLTHIGDYVRTIHFLKNLSALPVTSFQRVLDAGCGDGHHSFLVAKRFPHIHVTGMDIDLRDSKMSAAAPNVVLVRDDLLNLKDRARYDFVFSIDVMEHIPDNQAVLRNIFDALKPGGFFYLHLPNKNQGKNILPAKFLRHFHKWAEKEHVGKQYTIDQAATVLVQTGFTVMDAKFTFGRLGRLAWELDRATDRALLIKAMVMPFLKVLARASTLVNCPQGDLMLLARKPDTAGS